MFDFVTLDVITRHCDVPVGRRARLGLKMAAINEEEKLEEEEPRMITLLNKKVCGGDYE